MPKSNPVDETRSADAVERTKRQRRLDAKKAAEQRRRDRNGKLAGRVPLALAARTKPAIRKQTKQQTCLDLLSRREGATIEELQAATGWQQHSVRGFLAGAVKKKLGLTLLSEKPDAEPRRYRISEHGLTPWRTAGLPQAKQQLEHGLGDDRGVANARGSSRSQS